MCVRAARNGDSRQRLAGGLARTRADPTGPARSAQLAQGLKGTRSAVGTFPGQIAEGTRQNRPLSKRGGDAMQSTMYA